MLNRWVAGRRNELKPTDKRPHLASECFQLDEAEKWRRGLVKEISKKVALIQNAGMGEAKIRDLNDNINKLLREKHAWESRIAQLGGPNYIALAPKVLDSNGEPAVSMYGYKYFGAAKDLPGVRELFEKPPPAKIRKTRYELSRTVDTDYYGYRDEDDGVLLPLEAAAEQQARAEAVHKWQEEKERQAASEVRLGLKRTHDEADEVEDSGAGDVTEAQIAALVLRQKKEGLLRKLEAAGAEK
eukprot:TRINITY_DN9586_c0_g1_i1.p1 TRINITY_DN9586_c0_g1~~TRINITY_DN9586_c0_g1_i1.p1  ORF type:complete len:253 (-),score=78.96 TRINITY_DN9586_c0_g1_i1:33-758(-)